MRFETFDLETHLIKPGCPAPKMVCLSTADQKLFHRVEGLAWLKEQLENPDVVIVGHNVFYDLGVPCAEDPATFVPLVFKAFDNFRIRDTIVRQQLLDIAEGNLKYRWDEEKQEHVKTGYTLADLSLRLLNRVLPKEGTWRLKYALLDAVPISEWPEDAKSYAIDDSVTTSDVFWAQALKAGGNVDIGGVIPTEDRATREAWAFWLMGAWGVRTEGAVVAKLRAELEEEQRLSMEKLSKTNIIKRKKDGTWSRHMKAIYARIEAGFLAQSREVPRTGSGRVSSDHEAMVSCGDPEMAILAEAAGGAKLLTTYVPMLEHGAFYPINARWNVLVESYRSSCGKPNLQNLPRKGGARDCMIPRKGWVFCSVDYDTIELRSLAQSCLDLLGESAMAEALRKGEDLHVSLAAELIGISYEEASARYAAGDEEVGEMRQFAKCVSGDTLIHTVRGFVPIRDLVEHRKEGFADLSSPVGVVSRSGVENATQGYYGGVQPVYDLVTGFGFNVRATADHEFLTFVSGSFCLKKLSDLKKGDPLFFKLGAEVHGSSVEIPPLVTTGRTYFKGIPSFPKKLTRELAQVLGFLVSEGRCAKSDTGWSVKATQSDYDNDGVIEFLSNAMKTVFGDRCKEATRRSGPQKLREWSVYSLALAQWLISVGFGADSGSQAIPTVISAAPRALKIEFLRVLFEGDGSASSGGAGRGKIKIVRYCSKSRTLVQQIQLELMNLGIPSHVRSEERKGYGTYWNLSINGQRYLRKFRDEIGFVSERKNKVLESACEDRERDQPVLFLPGDREAWDAVRDRAVGCELREAIKRPLDKKMPVSELIVEKAADALVGDLALAFVDSLWMCPVEAITLAGEEEVFDLYEPEHEIAVFNGIVAHDCLNFGLPGGLGAEAFVGYAKAMANITISLEKSKELRDAWLRRWAEMLAYFNYVSSIAGRQGEGTVISPRSGFVRGGLTFTQLANHYFQHLTATGAKDAFWHISRECYTDPTSPLYGCRPVVFNHDEVIIEMLEPQAAAAAERQAEIQIAVMKKWIPDIPILAGPVLMRRWLKGAKAVRVDGKLVPSRPVKIEGKVKWVHDTGA